MDIFSDEYFMREAIKEAQKAFDHGEVPVGAIVVSNNTIIARAHNQVEILTDSTAHAEILAITSASNYLGSKYLIDCTIYITLEPCVMCASALFWAKIAKVVYAAADDKNGFMRFGKKILHPKTKLSYGILEAQSSSLLKGFFKARRTNT